ncbi:ABC transporter permease [Legionella sp. W05-934-2]|uniref:ABC transporter permease n=1 Tax=Legionella sp. W05-934-2 TaxID=1198649 RepID=UPI00346330D1
MKRKSLAMIGLYSWLILFALTPMLLVLITSFLTTSEQHLATTPLTLQAYFALLDPLLGKVFIRSIIMALIATVGCLILAYPFAYAMIKSRHQSLLLVLIIIPFWTSSLIRTYALIALLKYKGLINHWFMTLHIIEKPMSLLYSQTAVIIGLIYTLFPFMVLPIYTQMERFDFQLIDAARDLGANRWQVFSRVFLPNTIPGIIAGSLLVSLPAMTLFYIPNILGGARTVLLGNLIQDQFLLTQNWPQGAATSVALTVVLIGLLSLFKRNNKAVML